ncbi:hypothetical protein AB5I41_29310 [Sphingomonas sp. MMS24-JH45]
MRIALSPTGARRDAGACPRGGGEHAYPRSRARRRRRGCRSRCLARARTGRWQEGGAGTDRRGGTGAQFRAAGDVPAGDYRLHFDLGRYQGATGAPFFPEIALPSASSTRPATTTSPRASPYGRSTYRGN